MDVISHYFSIYHKSTSDIVDVVFSKNVTPSPEVQFSNDVVSLRYSVATVLVNGPVWFAQSGKVLRSNITTPRVFTMNSWTAQQTMFITNPGFAYKIKYNTLHYLNRLRLKIIHTYFFRLLL